jgi:uncharacterized protein (DUF1684 family)
MINYKTWIDHETGEPCHECKITFPDLSVRHNKVGALSIDSTIGLDLTLTGDQAIDFRDYLVNRDSSPFVMYDSSFQIVTLIKISPGVFELNVASRIDQEESYSICQSAIFTTGVS